MVDIAITVGTEIAKELAEPTKRGFRYLVHTETNVEDLREAVEDSLVGVKNDVKNAVNLARRRGEVVHNVVENWLNDVETIEKETKEISQERKQMKRFSKGWLCTRFRIGRKAKHKMDNVAELLVDRKTFERVADPAPLPPLLIENFQTFSCRQKMKTQLINVLTDGDFNSVGVYGMPGVGKTALLTEMYKEVKYRELFDEVVMVKVSSNPDLNGIQLEIAEELGLALKESSASVRAGRLLARQRQTSKILIILDDLWNTLDLHKVGIPNDHKGCKIVYVTRSLDICIEMETQANYEVQALSEQDSWTLFRHKVGHIVDNDFMQARSKEVLDECKGLPLAIVELAKILRNKEQDLWIDVAGQLKKSNLEVMTSVVSSIKLSYDHLQNKETKLCFLLCCLFPKGHRITIDELSSYMTVDTVLKEVDTAEEAMRMLNGMVKKLTGSCLLLKGDENGYALMHDVVRDTGITIVRQQIKGSSGKGGIGLKHWPIIRDGWKY